jgi:predicted ABC-type transport system involved in lysophospholipase L1 biosynthesis ATPase subunit
MTLVLVTHDMAVASVADRQVRLKDGKIDETAMAGAEVVRR